VRLRAEWEYTNVEKKTGWGFAMVTHNTAAISQRCTFAPVTPPLAFIYHCVPETVR